MIVIFLLFLNQFKQVNAIVGGYEIKPHGQALKYCCFLYAETIQSELKSALYGIIAKW